VVGYELGKTVSEYGFVSRGVCEVSNGNLSGITERTKIVLDNGKILYEDGDKQVELSPKTPVSMNFWGFAPSVFPISEKLFSQFLEQNISNPKSEFFIPIVVDQFIAAGMGSVKVIPTSSQWFGVTYKEDAPGVQASLSALVKNGEYPDNLWK
jgi:hypothetical protein